MIKNFAELEAGMSVEARARVSRRVAETLKEMERVEAAAARKKQARLSPSVGKAAPRNATVVLSPDC